MVEAVRDLPDEPPGSSPTNLTLNQFGGNRVIIDMGNGRYAEYEHLAPKSPTVHVGDYVRQDQKLGCWEIPATRTRRISTFSLAARPV